MVERGLADAIIVTGPRTGSPPSAEDLKALKGLKEVLIGSGLDHENARILLPLADGAIVASCLRKGGNVMNPVDLQRVELPLNRTKSEEMKVLVIGDLSVSVAAETSRLPRPGENLILRNPTLIASGVAANISADLRRLGVDTYVSGVVGRDVFGGAILRALPPWGVHTRHIGRSPRPTS